MRTAALSRVVWAHKLSGRKRTRLVDQATVLERRLRGGRSGGDVARRGWAVMTTELRALDFGSACGGSSDMWHQESILAAADAAGACGISRFSEQPGPEQGRSRRRSAEPRASASACNSPSASIRESELTEDRSALDVTPWPQPARASRGAKAITASGTKSAAASDCFARSRAENIIVNRGAQGSDDQTISKRVVTGTIDCKWLF
jgi:hypothetical protein